MLNAQSHAEQNTLVGHIFIGTVVFNTDPLKLERIKVTVPKLYESSDPSLLPWVGRLDSASIRNLDPASGSFGLVPKVGSLVYIQLQDGKPDHPVYFGSPQVQDNRVAEADVNYPNRYGWKDPAGNLFLVDTTPGSNTVSVTHASGASITIDNAGNISVTSPGNMNFNSSGNTTFNAGGDFTVVASKIHLNP